MGDKPDTLLADVHICAYFFYLHPAAKAVSAAGGFSFAVASTPYSGFFPLISRCARCMYSTIPRDRLNTCIVYCVYILRWLLYPLLEPYYCGRAASKRQLGEQRPCNRVWSMCRGRGRLWSGGCRIRALIKCRQKLRQGTYLSAGQSYHEVGY